ncbi:hypothetical protein [Roseobacter sp. S98]|uniref:hypothetical protein n=1 Tax=Roseobacter algicola (ex Choi et al. 2025) (nom. illeg.) TaxID=3092138 RepID=UPI0035C6894E
MAGMKMHQKQSEKPDGPAENAEKREPAITTDDESPRLMDRSDLFEHHNWINEACGDDLWEL